MRFSEAVCLTGLLLVGLTSCHTEMTAVSVSDPSGRRVDVREEPGVPTEREGVVAGDPWRTPRYWFDEPLSPGDGSAFLAVSYRGTADSPVLRLFDKEGALLREVSLPAPSAVGKNSLSVSVGMPERAIGSLEVRVPCECGRLELESLAVRKDAELFRRETDTIALRYGTGYRKEGPHTELTLPDAEDAIRVTLRGREIAGNIPSADVIAPSFERPSVTLEVGDLSRWAVYPRDGELEIYLYSATVGGAIDRLVLDSGPLDVELVSADAVELSADPNVPLAADPWTILTYPQEQWRTSELEVFEWAAYPDVFILDFRDYAVQSDYFRRLAFFTEKRGYRGRIPPVSELAARHGWNAHNYSADGLHAFFETAAAEGYALTEGETALRRLAVDLGILVEDGNGLRAGAAGLLSISRESPPILRELLLTHEAFHGVFYVRPEFRRFTRDVWQAMPESARSFWTGFLSYMTYDPSDSYLMVNEFQAYVLQQRPRAVDWYFSERVGERLVRAGSPAGESLRALVADSPRYFWDTARTLNSFVLRSENLLGGDVYALRPIE